MKASGTEILVAEKMQYAFYSQEAAQLNQELFLMEKVKHCMHAKLLFLSNKRAAGAHFLTCFCTQWPRWQVVGRSVLQALGYFLMKSEQLFKSKHKYTPFENKCSDGHIYSKREKAKDKVNIKSSSTAGDHSSLLDEAFCFSLKFQYFPTGSYTHLWLSLGLPYLFFQSGPL